VAAGNVVVVMDNGVPAGLTTRENTWESVAAGMLESVTVMVKEDVPAVVGVPEITPVAPSNVSPAGRAPTVTAQVYVAVPPTTASVWLYAEFTVAAGSVVVVMAIALIVMDKAKDAVCGDVAESVAVTVKVDVPGTVGVPEITPEALSKVRPAGRAPAVIDHV